jgi:hypothetical protein
LHAQGEQAFPRRPDELAEEVDEVVGPKGRHDAERTAVRHGHEHGALTLGARRSSTSFETTSARALLG